MLVKELAVVTPSQRFFIVISDRLYLQFDVVPHVEEVVHGKCNHHNKDHHHSYAKASNGPTV